MPDPETVIRHVAIRVSGQVQGVFFRHSAKQLADRRSITGIARNMPDGTVLIEAEGPPEAIEAFIRWCHDGPPDAAVEQVTVTDGKVAHYQEFTIQAA